MKELDKKEFIKAMEKEWHDQSENGNFSLVKQSQVPEGARSVVLLAAAAYCYTLGKQDDKARFSDNCVPQG